MFTIKMCVNEIDSKNTGKTYKVLFVLIAFIFAFSLKANASAVISRRQEMQKSSHPEYKAHNSENTQSRNGNGDSKKNPGGMPTKRYEEESIAFDALWKELKISSESWPLIMDVKPKEIIVSRYIDLYRRQGVVIKKSPLFYAEAISAMANSNQAILKNPFQDVLKFVAITEYDFDNGQDKDKMALMVLGQKLYKENKKRLGK